MKSNQINNISTNTNGKTVVDDEISHLSVDSHFTDLTNEQLGKMVKKDPSVLMYLQLTDEMKRVKDDHIKLIAEVNIIKKSYKSLKNHMDDNNKDLLEVSKDQTRLTDKFDNMAHDNTGTFELFKATAKKQVFNLLRGRDQEAKKVLFFRSFMSKIYSDIYNHFGANNSGSIRMEDSEVAISMAKKWRPDKKYLNYKINELVRMQANGTLDSSKDRAFDIIMESTEGGTKDLFQ